MFKLFLVLLLFAAQYTATHKILIGNIFSSTSHIIPLASLAEGLLEQGHEVTFIVGKKFSVLPEKAKQILLQDIPKDISQVAKGINESAIRRGRLFYEAVKGACDVVSSNEALASHLREQKYDVFIISVMFQQCLLTTVLHYQPDIPYIMYIPGISVSLLHAPVTGHHPWTTAYIPLPMHSATEQMTFKQRLSNFLILQILKGMLNFLMWPLDDILRKNLGEGMPSVYEAQRNASFLFINSNFEFDYPLPVSPEVVMTGCMQCHPGQQLPQKIRKFINAHKKYGVIVFSLGSVLSASSIPAVMLDTFIEAFKDMPHGIIFHTDENRENLPQNIITQSWLPMQDVLADPAIKVIISHGGYMTLQETMYHGVPYLGFPIFGEGSDRLRNVMLAEYRGIGLNLDVNNVTKSAILDKLNLLLTDRRYKDNALRMSNLLKNKMAHPRDEAIYKINFAIRYKGNIPFKSYAHNLTTIQYYSFDVVAVLLIFLIVILCVFIIILRLVWRILRYFCTGKKLKQQ